MSTLIRHLDWWPYCETYDISAAPVAVGVDFPLAFDDPSDAMRHFWRIREWTAVVENVSVGLSKTVTLTPYKWDGGIGAPITDELDLICCHQGIAFDHQQTMGTFSLHVYLYSGVPRVADGPQVYHNPETDPPIWIPRLATHMNAQDSDTITYDIGFTNDPNSTFSGGPVSLSAAFDDTTIDLTGSNDGNGPTSIYFSPSRFWSHGGTWNTSTGARVT